MFKNIKSIPYDPIFKLMDEFNADSREDKINLGIGIYTDNDGQPYVMSTIRQAAREVNMKNFNYDPLSGNADFLKNIQSLFFPELKDALVCQQTCGGTHGMQMAAELLYAEGCRNVILGLPTWDNYFSIFHKYSVHKYEQWQSGFDCLDRERLVRVIESAPSKSVLLLQGAKATNPIGFNFTVDELAVLKDLVVKKEIYILVDFAYSGLGDGFYEDLKWINELMNVFSDIAAAVSFSKNATLYKHRLGVLFVKTEDKDLVVSNLRNIIRQTISMAPSFGSDMMNIVISERLNDWLDDLENMRQSIMARRRLFVEGLPEKYAHLAKGAGMFGLMDFDAKQIARLKEEFGIYMLGNSRINFAGLVNRKIDFITNSINKVL